MIFLPALALSVAPVLWLALVLVAASIAVTACTRHGAQDSKSKAEST